MREKINKSFAKIKKEKGITLVALVITIVLLIILSTVTINVAMGENGLINQARRARILSEQEASEEEGQLNTLIGTLTDIISGIQEITVEYALENNIEFTDTTKIIDNLKNIITIPGGFHIADDSGKLVEEGIVIEDKAGNQFVWIPVDEKALAEMYVDTSRTALSGTDIGINVDTDIYSKLINDEDGTLLDENTNKPGTEGYREPDILIDTNSGDASSDGINQIKEVFGEELGITEETNIATVLNAFANMLVKEYKETYESIKEYGGFYIGRYEICGDINEPIIKQGEKVLTKKNWYQLKKACNNVKNTKYAMSGMIYGNQWDRVINWILETDAKTEEEVFLNSSSWGNYTNSEGNAITDSGSIRTSGKNEAWQVNNIYDLAGNASEWTQEGEDLDIRVDRGR